MQRDHDSPNHGLIRTRSTAPDRPTVLLQKMYSKKKIETEIIFRAGGRVQLPVGAGYAPHFVAEGDDAWLAVRFVDFPVDAKFDSPCRVNVELLYPGQLDYTKLVNGATFEVHEGPKIVATGRILKY